MQRVTHQGSLLSTGVKSTFQTAGFSYLSPGCNNLFSVVIFFRLSTRILSLTTLELGSKSISLSLGLCVSRPRQYDRMFGVDHFFHSLLLPGWLFGGQNQWMWLVSYRRRCWLGPYQIPSVGGAFHHSCTSKLINLSQYRAHCAVKTNCGGRDELVWLIYIGVRKERQG